MKTLILGIGNTILTDDGVGIKVARKLKEASPQSEVVETSEAGIALLELIAGYDRLIIIDSIQTEQGELGELYKLELKDLKPTADFASFHGINIGTVFELGRRLGYMMPGCVSLYGVEIKDNLTFGEQCTEEIEKRIPAITEQIIKEERI